VEQFGIREEQRCIPTEQYEAWDQACVRMTVDIMISLAVANFTDAAALKATKALENAAREGNLQAASDAYRKVTAELDRLESALTNFSHRQRGLKAKAQSTS
jgi:hypothetical protein